jgi:hypothetical protein
LETDTLEVAAFENVKNQTGFCGIWCGSCAAGNGAMTELTRKYEDLVKKHNLEKWASKRFDFKEFAKGLACIQTMPLCSGCRKGGGSSTCKIRICALEKGLTDCSECDQLIACRNFEQLEKTNPKIKEDLMKLRGADRERTIEKWTDESRKRWPHCILSCASTKT